MRVHTVLALPQRPVDGVGPGHQLLVAAPLGHGALVEHEDLVAVYHGGEPVGDDDAGPAPGGLVEGAHDGGLGDGVEGGGGLVEDEDGRVLEDGAGDGHALLLAAGELQAALADLE